MLVLLTLSHLMESVHPLLAYCLTSTLLGAIASVTVDLTNPNILQLNGRFVLINMKQTLSFMTLEIFYDNV